MRKEFSANCGIIFPAITSTNQSTWLQPLDTKTNRVQLFIKVEVFHNAQASTPGRVRKGNPMLEKIVSGGQTGADRAALDSAIKHGIPHGGWVPKGRLAEDGPLADNYDLKEMPSDSYPARTEQNVIDSDGTLIISNGPLTGGSDYTREMAKKHKKPRLHINLSHIKIHEAGATIMIWLTGNAVSVLNVAGPRASKDPHIYQQVLAVLEHVVFLKKLKQENPLLFSAPESQKDQAASKPMGLPATVDEAVESILSELTLEESAILANTSEENLSVLSQVLSLFIDTKLGDSTVNRALFEDCRVRSRNPNLNEAEASKVIIEAIWQKVRQTHRLRVVK